MKNTVIVVLAVLCWTAFMYSYNTRRKSSLNYDHFRDSISQVIHKYDSLSNIQDSTLKSYKDSITVVNTQIIEKEKDFEIIKYKYNEIHNHISLYSSSQLDSFFKARYRY